MSIILSGDNGVTFPNATVQASSGVVLQVVSANYGTVLNVSTSTFTDTGLTASITPKFSTSKILVLINHSEVFKNADNSNNDIGFNLCRNGSQIVQFNSGLLYTATALRVGCSASYTYLDSPATTSSTAYKTQVKNGDNNGTSITVQGNNMPATITLMEIAG